MENVLMWSLVVSILVLGWWISSLSIPSFNVRGRHKKFMKKIHADPVFGPAYREALREDGGRPGLNTFMVVRMYKMRDGIG